MSHSVLITGASRDIGRAIALACARSGDFSRLVLTCRQDASALADTVRLVSGAGDLICFSDTGDTGDLPFVQSLLERFGPVDTLINNSAVSFHGLLTDMPPEDWDLILRSNVTSVFNTCRTFVPHMVSSGGGRIINISSVWGEVGASCEAAYSATKGAVNALTRALAKELAPSRIRVNAVAPGMVDTRMNDNLSDEEKELLRQEIPAGYIARPEEIALAVMKLLDMPEYFNGQIVRLDGCWQ